jgi:hypothetical protein
MLDLRSSPLATREEIKQVGDGIVASIVAASLSPSARTGPVAAITLSVHTGIAAQDTQHGGELCVFKSVPSGSILSVPSLNGNLLAKGACTVSGNACQSESSEECATEQS